MIMNIEFTYRESTNWCNGIDVFANEAPIGIIDEIAHDCLNWHPGMDPDMLRFSLRKEETFSAVVSELRRYKDERGYKYLTIWTYNSGIASLFSRELLERLGFRNLPDCNPACFYLE